MALARFSIIVAIDSGNGIAKDRGIPWPTGHRGTGGTFHPSADMKFFRDVTVGNKKNAVIMGRLTYESIPNAPLRDRHNIVISRTMRQEDHLNVTVCESFLNALITLGGSIKQYDEIFVIGGEQIYREVVDNYLYLCNRLYVTRFKNDYDCDQFFPWDEVKDFPNFMDTQKTIKYQRFYLAPNVAHPEYEYLRALKYITERGEERTDRTGTGTKQVFGLKMEFDISERFPLLTTKKVSFDNIAKELLFFVSGKTNTKILEDQGVNIWKANTSREFLNSRELDYEEGDYGCSYGFQWRHWNAFYQGCEEDYSGQGIDQLSILIHNIKEEPHSRRHILTAWNVSQIDKMALPPCHCFVQFNVSGDRKYLDCQLYQRSGDMFLGVPYNIASYSLLTYMIAHLTQLKPRKFIHTIGDAHIYSNHALQVNTQLNRTPRQLPKLSFRKGTKIKTIDDFSFDNFMIENYTSWPHIPAKMAV